MVRVRLLALAALFSCCHVAAAASIPQPRFGRFALDGRGRRGGQPPPVIVPPSSINSTTLYSALRRDILFLEKFVALLYRMASGSVDAICKWVMRSVTPRVICVTLTGIIAAEEDVRLLASAEEACMRPQLLCVEAGGLERLDGLRAAYAAGGGDPSNDHRRRGGGGSPVAGRGGRDAIINLERLDKQLTKAFAAHGAKAVCLLINSPGGSPAQSSLIYQRLRELKRLHKNKKLLAFVEDAACSGGYYIASAADEIIADPSSLVGSIGVISRSFGYVKAIKKQGVSRRVYAAGESKGGIDPYMRQKSRDLKSQRRLLTELHDNFIAAVKEGRGERLNPEAAARLHVRTVGGAGCAGLLFGKPSSGTVRSLAKAGKGLFDGTVYTGQVAQEVGLVDGVGDMKSILQQRYGRFCRIDTIEEEKPDLTRLLRWLL